MKNKHAYLIMAHNQFDILKKQLLMLDDERNDFFIHIDAKSKDFDREDIASCIKKGRIHFTKQISVMWGGSSQVDCEMLLLKKCVRCGEYAYVHLLSGVDLPIQNKEYILNFFDENPNMQFLQIGYSDKHLYRLNRYHLFLNHPNVPKVIKENISRIVEVLSHKLKIDRLKKYGDLKIVKTANWFSITGECAEYIVSQEKFIRKFTKHTVCADEMFLGTVIRNSKFWEQVYNKDISWDGHMRYIDRINNEGSSPHTLTMADKDILLNSDMLWARKFDETADNNIIEYLFEKYKS